MFKQTGVGKIDFGRSVNPISTREKDYAHLIATGTPGFSDLPTALPCKYLVKTLKLRAPTLSLVCDLRRKFFQKISLFVLFNDLMCKTWCHSIVEISKFDGMKHEKTPSKQCREVHDYNPLVRDIFLCAT